MGVTSKTVTKVSLAAAEVRAVLLCSFLECLQMVGSYQPQTCIYIYIYIVYIYIYVICVSFFLF